MNEKAQWQNRTGLLFKSTSPMSPSPSPLCSLQSQGGRSGRERKRERGEQGLHQGCSLDRANKSRPVTCSMAPFQERGQVRSERGERQACSLFSGEAAHSPQPPGGKEGRGGKHLLPWLRAGYGDPTIEEPPFSCSHRGNVTHL